jgi:hypothetical protein
MSAVVTMSVQTAAVAMRAGKTDIRLAVVFGFGLVWARRRVRRGVVSAIFLGFAMVGIFSMAGCGNRSFDASAGAAQSFPIVVTGTSTNLAGALVTHTALVTLVVE